ncbi:MAG: hypothetical protein GF344_20155, partial [Chitinivibrionales bacterium]|nr:hypothetical protein [Chitinivibrionales bacterium]MBD3358928.1 hypothetical protein [Chitinivibrionales bacterium]
MGESVLFSSLRIVYGRVEGGVRMAREELVVKTEAFIAERLGRIPDISETIPALGTQSNGKMLRTRLAAHLIGDYADERQLWTAIHA